jgi:tetratricopeptide (TPR) repeat protein
MVIPYKPSLNEFLVLWESVEGFQILDKGASIMTIDFSPTVSKSLFVGRQNEMDIFHRIMSEHCPEWIIHIPGKGGVGKTRLVENFRDQAEGEPNVLCTGELIDFYKTTNQTSVGLLQEITRQLGIVHFPLFLLARDHFQNILKMESEPGERQEVIQRVTEAFLKDYKALLEKRYHVLFLFDTCEEMHTIETWVLSTLLKGISEIEKEMAEELLEEGAVTRRFQTVFVLAGRKRITFMSELEAHVIVLELSTLTLEETQAFFEQGKIDAKMVNLAEITQLYERTGGRPLYVALTYDWLKNEVGTVPELLTIDESFGEKLVGWVRRLDTIEKQVILYMALAWRRMEPTLLARLLKEDPPTAEGIIEELSRFSFVKYRRPQGEVPQTLQLHDEMRSLINTYVWPQEGELTQEALRSQIIDWYKDQIGDPEILKGERLPENSEQRGLLAEWLFYQFQVNPDTAMDTHERLFRKASHFLDLAFCDLLNQEANRFIDQIPLHKKDDLRFREALVNFRLENFKDASQIWYSLLRRPDLKATTRATILMLLVELESYMGQPDRALKRAEEGEALYLKLIEEEADPNKREILQSQLGQLYNNRGYVHRVNVDFPKALEYYNKALQNKTTDQTKNIARTLNNMGYIYFLQGDLTQARTHVGRALQYRRKLGIPYELTLGYNTMGIILEHSGRLKEAIDLYDKALAQARIARSDRGEALVLHNLGRIKRFTNEYQDSLAYLEKARQVFQKLQDKDHLILTLNELGCSYRQRGEEGDLSKALALLDESRKFSHEFGQTLVEADNWEDISIVYRLLAVEAHTNNDQEAFTQYAQAVRDAAKHVRSLAEQHGHTYLIGKSNRTLGDLAYLEKNYDEAFTHYFGAGLEMVRAWLTGKYSPLLIQRRYEEMVDRMQEQLQALPDSEDTRNYAQKLLKRLEALSVEEQMKMEHTKEFLEATLQMAKLLG